jgi:hypothetical protein
MYPSLFLFSSKCYATKVQNPKKKLGPTSQVYGLSQSLSNVDQLSSFLGCVFHKCPL